MSTVVYESAALTQQDRRAGFVERAQETSADSGVSLVSVLPELQAVPQHHVQKQDSHLTNHTK